MRTSHRSYVAGDFFVDGEAANAAFVVGEIKAKSKTIAMLTTSNSIAFPGGVQPNTKDDVVIGDQSGAAVYTYSLKGTELTVKATTPLTGSADAVTFALSSIDADLYAADVGNADLYEFAYPKGGSPIETVGIGNGSPVGAAVTPLREARSSLRRGQREGERRGGKRDAKRLGRPVRPVADRPFRPNLGTQ